MGTGMIWIIFIGIAAVSWLVQMNLQNKFKKYSKIPTGNGMTGRDVALQMLHDNGIYDVQVTHTPGQLTDQSLFTHTLRHSPVHREAELCLYFFQLFM